MTLSMSPTTVEQELNKRQAIIDELLAGGRRNKIRSRCYVVELELPYLDYAYAAVSKWDTSGNAVQGSVLIDRGSTLFVKRIDHTMSTIGTLNNSSQVADITIPPCFRWKFYSFLWRVKDTGSDRDWSNDWLDEYLLRSGQQQGLVLRRAHARVSGGSTLTVSLIPKQMENNPSYSGLSTVSKVKYRFAFHGVEVLS